MSAPALRVEGLTAGYSGSVVIDGISLEVEPGEVVALLGRNGVGKSTAVGAISGTIPASAGSVFLAGHDVSSRAPSHRFALGRR
jgi:branched-chain amino acid transport system ATP-binding protein